MVKVQRVRDFGMLSPKWGIRTTPSPFPKLGHHHIAESRKAARARDVEEAVFLVQSCTEQRNSATVRQTQDGSKCMPDKVPAREQG